MVHFLPLLWLSTRVLREDELRLSSEECSPPFPVLLPSPQQCQQDSSPLAL